LIAGILPFGAMFIELFFIFSVSSVVTSYAVSALFAKHLNIMFTFWVFIRYC